jgi:hypothetical protein
MNKHPITSLLSILALAAVPVVAPPALAHSSARTASAYPIPPASTTPAAAAHAGASAAAGDLAKLSPAALAHTGGLKLSVTAPGSGAFTFVLTAKIHGKTVIVGRAVKTVTGAGAVTLTLKLTKAGKAALGRAKGKLKLTVAVTFKPTHGGGATAKSKITLK